MNHNYNKIHNKNLIILMLGLLCLSSVYFLFISTSSNKFISPDETINYFYINLYSETGNLSYHDDLNKISYGIIRPRGTVYFQDHVAPQKYNGFIILVGTVESIISGSSRFITLIFALAGLLYLYIISKELFDEKTAILTSIILGILPYYLYWTSLSMFENMLGTSIFIIFVRYFLRIFKYNDSKDYILTAIFFSVSIFIRPELILISPIIIVLLFLNIRKKIKQNCYKAVLFALTFLLFIMPFFLLNYGLYGGYLTTGQHVQYHFEEPIPVNRAFNFNNIITNIINIFGLYPIFSLGILLGIFGTISFKDNLYKSYIALVGLGFLFLSAYILSDRVLDQNIHSSYVRYFLPLIALLSPFFGMFAIRMRPVNRYVSMLLVTYLVVFSVIAATTEFYSEQKAIKNYENINMMITTQTETNAVIFLDYWDKAIFPDRKVGLVRELPKQKNKSQILAQISIKIFETNTPVYILMSKEFSNYIQINDFKKELARQKYSLVLTKVDDLYKLNRMNS